MKRGGARGKHGFFTIFKHWNADAVVNFSHVINIITCITIPTLVVWQYNKSPNSMNELEGEYMSKAIEGFFLLMSTVVMFMKLISYAHVHDDYRKAAKEAATVPMDQVCRMKERKRENILLPLFIYIRVLLCVPCVMCVVLPSSFFGHIYINLKLELMCKLSLSP